MHNKCKGPEVGTSWVDSGNRGEARVAEVERLMGNAMWSLGGCDKDLGDYSKSQGEHLWGFFTRGGTYSALGSNSPSAWRTDHRGDG